MASLRVSPKTRIEQLIACGYSDHHIGQVLGCSLAAVLAQREYLEAVIREADPQIGHTHGKQQAKTVKVPQGIPQVGTHARLLSVAADASVDQ